MICYRDRTFCSMLCANYACHRLVTVEVEESAKKEGLDLCLAMMKTENCGYKKPDISTAAVMERV